MPDTDTVWALNRLAVLEVFAGSPDADRLSAEALTLGQALGVGPSQLAELFLTRGLYHVSAERRPQAISYLRESARLAAQAGDDFCVGRALLNLADALACHATPPPRPTPPGPRPGTCAAPEPGVTWPWRS